MKYVCINKEKWSTFDMKQATGPKYNEVVTKVNEDDSLGVKFYTFKEYPNEYLAECFRPVINIEIMEEVSEGLLIKENELA